jgi:hypothetical protein
MIRGYGTRKYAVWVICLTNGSLGHLAVALPVAEGNMTILDPAGHFYTKNKYGVFGYKDASLAVKEWVDYWNFQMRGSVRVEMIFSDVDYKTFGSTDEFIVWSSTSESPLCQYQFHSREFR